jgi:integrase
VAFLMATGLRIGEACGLTWNTVDLQAGTIEVRAAAVRVRGRGLVVKTTKTDAGTRNLVLPRWCTAMLRDRADRLNATADDRAGRPVFPAPLGDWRGLPRLHGTRGTPRSQPKSGQSQPAAATLRWVGASALGVR